MTGRSLGTQVGGQRTWFLSPTRYESSYQNKHHDGYRTAFLQAETFQVDGLPGHGTSGPIKVSMGAKMMSVGQDYLDAAAEFDKARTSTKDTNNFGQCDQYSVRRFSTPAHWKFMFPFDDVSLGSSTITGCPSSSHPY